MCVTADSNSEIKRCDAAAEKSVENHRRNTDGQSGRGIDKRLADALRKHAVTRRAKVRAERAERANNSDHRPKQSKQRRNHSDVGEISDAIVQIRRDPRPFRFRDFTDLLEIGVRIFGGESRAPFGQRGRSLRHGDWKPRAGRDNRVCATAHRLLP